MTSSNKRARLAKLQGAVFIATGVWPLVHLGSFEAVTGPKVDDWLVKTVGLQTLMSGAILYGAGHRQQISHETVWLGIGSAASLATIDLIYVARRRISPIYLLDAAMEVFFVGRWLRS